MDAETSNTAAPGTAQPSDPLELIHLADGVQSVSVRLTSTTPVLEGVDGLKYYDAVAVVTSDFANGTVHLGCGSEEIADWGRLVDAVEEFVDDPDSDPDEPYAADWPPSGNSAYLRFFAEDPYVVEVRDGSGTGVVVSVPLDLPDGWTTDARRRLASARAALGE
ncbi:DUF5959 family protein [Streptomyces californicus]|uniref:DUF5959 family protein n=1 Tax=Streptomyces californicus TaxID=67351 RepID=UPI00378DB10F